MIPWTVLDSAPLPDGSGDLRLKQRGSEFSIMLGSNELMNSRLSGSEEALAKLVCERLGQRPGIRMLIGGLGMGFTLRAALTHLPPDAEVEVAELIPAVVDWARGPMAAVFAGCLDDPRTQLTVADVAGVITNARGRYDAILLDVDNGPEGLTVAGNDRLYAAGGLHAAKEALRPGGILAIWSSGPDHGFTRRLRSAGFATEEITARARRTGGGARHVIWLAARR
ncbi:spermidine synthase [Bosea sp. TAF32]|uniref:spermidine synthase n=1 Tax=Bosea sp. TAF32 TaxID=3237482 RepID=UPI003F90B616